MSPFFSVTQEKCLRIHLCHSNICNKMIIVGIKMCRDGDSSYFWRKIFCTLPLKPTQSVMKARGGERFSETEIVEKWNIFSGLQNDPFNCQQANHKFQIKIQNNSSGLSVCGQCNQLLILMGYFLPPTPSLPPCLSISSSGRGTNCAKSPPRVTSRPSWAAAKKQNWSGEHLLNHAFCTWIICICICA